MPRIGSTVDCEEEGPPGGFEKNHRTKPRDGRKSWKIKTPRAKKVAEVVDEEAEERIATLLEKTRPQSQTSVIVLPTVPAASPLRRIKEDINMNSKPPVKYCPTCLGDKPKVCGEKIEGICDECADVLDKETGTAIALGKLVTIRDWMANRLGMLEAKYASAKAVVDETERECIQEANEHVAKTVGNAEVSRGARIVAFQAKKKELWFNKKGGNAKFATMKNLENRVNLLKAVLAKAANDATDKAGAKKVTETAAEKTMPAALLVITDPAIKS